MREYGKVRTAFWTDEKIVRLTDTAKLYALYLMTGPHTNMTGCFRLPPGYVAGDLSIPNEMVYMAEHELLQAGFMNRCEKTGFVFLPNFVKHNPIANVNQGKAFAKTVWELPKDCVHLPDIATVLETIEDKLPKSFVKRFRERFADGISNGSGNGSADGISNRIPIQEPEPEQEPEQDQEQKPEPESEPENARARSSFGCEGQDESAARPSSQTSGASAVGGAGRGAFPEDWFVGRILPEGWPVDIERGDPLDPQTVLDLVGKGAAARILGPAAARLKQEVLKPLRAVPDTADDGVPDIPAFMDRRPKAAHG
tara:strand:+ start:1753 stop:2688 length:936 start_codon:yes stop_codon:yes gene_type:complete